MNLFKIKYQYVQPSFMIVEAEDVDEAAERFAASTEGAIDPKIIAITRLDEVPETAPPSKHGLN